LTNTGKIGEYSPKLEKLMKTTKFIFWVLILLTLTACVGAEKVQVETPMVTAEEEILEDLPTETATAAPQEEESPTDEPEDVEAEAIQPSGEQLASECTLVSSLPDAPDEYAELFSIQDNDWVSGSDDAAITLIEYGDFQ
jgi:hypothetical protein